MNLLLDTHVWLWWLADDSRLSGRAREAIAAPSATVRISAASLWEISIKEALGRIQLRGADLVAQIDAGGFVELPVSARHGLAAGRLPRHHEDPFDRMLVAQARLEKLTLVTADPALSAYDVDVLEN